jgi:RNA polymerase sigma factor (TIGR02999 family)
MGEITKLIRASNSGDQAALGGLFQILYDDLRLIAHRRMQLNGAVTSLDTTSLLHETYLRLLSGGELQLNDRRHFFAYAATAMRHIVVDFVRKRLAEKRGGEIVLITLNTNISDSACAGSDEVLRVQEALEVLGTIDARLVSVVELRYFCGMTEIEIADALELNVRTVNRDWEKAKLLLMSILKQK